MRIAAIPERKCDECGKLLFPTPMWVYKIRKMNQKTRYYCSYTCYTKGLWKYDD